VNFVFAAMNAKIVPRSVKLRNSVKNVEKYREKCRLQKMTIFHKLEKLRKSYGKCKSGVGNIYFNYLYEGGGFPLAPATSSWRATTRHLAVSYATPSAGAQTPPRNALAYHNSQFGFFR
jgi:hypothetical protein